MQSLPMPSRLALAGEGLGLMELPRLLWKAPDLARQPRGNGRVVLVLPGYGAGDGSTALLRGYLSLLGHDPRGWGLGRNDGDVRNLAPRVADLVAEAAEASGRPVALVGWSLGGVLAREAARERPDAVTRVVTFGSPVVGGPKYTAAAPSYCRRGYDLDEIERQVAERNRVPIRRPVTAIYSRWDGVVAWRACVDEHSPDVEHVEVRTTHLGLGFSAEVYGIVARRLAQADGEA